MFVLCAIWLVKRKATCVTKWFRKCMAELSGKCSRELECPRDFQMWTGYERRGVAARRREKHQRSEREHQRASESEREEETCCLRACVVNRDCVIAILRPVVCSSVNIATEYTGELCENPRALSSLSTRATALL